MTTSEAGREPASLVAATYHSSEHASAWSDTHAQLVCRLGKGMVRIELEPNGRKVVWTLKMCASG